MFLNSNICFARTKKPRKQNQFEIIFDRFQNFLLFLFFAVYFQLNKLFKLIVLEHTHTTFYTDTLNYRQNKQKHRQKTIHKLKTRINKKNYDIFCLKNKNKSSKNK